MTDMAGTHTEPFYLATKDNPFIVGQPVYSSKHGLGAIVKTDWKDERMDKDNHRPIKAKFKSRHKPFMYRKDGRTGPRDVSPELYHATLGYVAPQAELYLESASVAPPVKLQLEPTAAPAAPAAPARLDEKPSPKDFSKFEFGEPSTQQDQEKLKLKTWRKMRDKAKLESLRNMQELKSATIQERRKNISVLRRSNKILSLRVDDTDFGEYANLRIGGILTNEAELEIKAILLLALTNEEELLYLKLRDIARQIEELEKLKNSTK